MEKEREREMQRETTHSPQLTVTKNILPKTNKGSPPPPKQTDKQTNKTTHTRNDQPESQQQSAK